MGAKSIFRFKCLMCNKEEMVHSEDPNSDIDMNTLAVTAILITGGGYSQYQEMNATMDIPSMTQKTYSKHHDIVSSCLQHAAWEEMQKAGEEEARLAKEAGEVDVDGVPIISVIADGAWSKRSYRSNYNALSGVACIIGLRTKKVLFIGVKNKYCSVCARRVFKKEAQKNDHNCYMNWKGSSTGMEAEIILEGFRKSLEMHNIKYGCIIADGDSSVYRKIRDCAPYGQNLIVKKIECTNHLLRCYMNKLKEISKTPRTNINVRKFVAENLLRFRTAVTKAVEYRRNTPVPITEKIRELRKDILNGPSHIFGDHNNCAARNYFCTKTNELQMFNALDKKDIFEKIMIAVERLAKNAESLIESQNNNSAESFNSIVAKFVGGKRINFSLRNGYNTRCDAAVLSHNSANFHESIQTYLGNKNMGVHTKKYASKIQKIKRNKTSKVSNKRRKTDRGGDADLEYGPDAANPTEDMTHEQLEKEKNTYLQSLTKINRNEIFEKTVEQRHSDIWYEERRKRCTASNFGSICKKKATTPMGKKVFSLLYSNFRGNTSTMYGIQNEKLAISTFEKKFQMKVEPSGLLIDEKLPFLAASPDGLIDLDKLIEIKCPAKIKALTIESAVEQNEINFLRIYNGELMLKENHNYMFQIQGQLHIAKRKLCFFVVWSPYDMFVQIINRDDLFWQEKMEEQLKKFYHDGMLPELIDSRYVRDLPPREAY